MTQSKLLKRYRRFLRIYYMYYRGVSLVDIGKTPGVTKQRIKEIIEEFKSFPTAIEFLNDFIESADNEKDGRFLDDIKNSVTLYSLATKVEELKKFDYAELCQNQ